MKRNKTRIYQHHGEDDQDKDDDEDYAKTTARLGQATDFLSNPVQRRDKEKMAIKKRSDTMLQNTAEFFGKDMQEVERVNKAHVTKLENQKIKDKRRHWVANVNLIEPIRSTKSVAATPTMSPLSPLSPLSTPAPRSPEHFLYEFCSMSF